MLVIAILTIISFIWFYNRTNLSQVGSNDAALVYGRVVQRAEIDSMARSYRLALALGLTDFVRDLGGMGENEESSLNDYIINLMLIRHQAPEFGIRPSDDDVAAMIKSLPILQTSGVFDPAKYASFLQDQLAPLGFTERQLEEIIRDSIRLKELRAVVVSSVAVGENQVRDAARIYQPVTGQILRFDRDPFMKEVTVTSDEITAFYSKNKEGLRSPEKRSISYVVFELPVASQQLAGKERANALQKLADEAVAVGKTMRDGISKGLDFEKVAANATLQPKQVASLERDGRQNGKDSGVPDPVVASAFRLQKTGEISDIIQDGNSFYIVTAEGITPARQMEMSEVADKITTLLKTEKADKASTDAAAKTLAQIRSSIASGKSFADAIRPTGIKTQPISGIVPSDPKNTEELRAFTASTLSLKEGEVGPLQPAPWGAFATYLEKRTPLTDAQWKEHEAPLSANLLANEQELLFMEWLRAARVAAQIRPLGGRGGA